jgi:ATP-dependent DNA ligase
MINLELVSFCFIEPMLLLRTGKLTEGVDLQYEIKFDGYRALAIKERGQGAAPREK